jgi:DNA-binding SARP family transcriptional activator
MRIYLLGTFEIKGERDVLATSAWRSQQNRTLLKILLLNRRHVVTTDQLLDLLWPDEEPEVTRPRLYVRISQIRRMLDPENSQAYIRSVDGGYRFDPEPVVWIDVDALESAAARGRSAQEAGAREGAIAAYEEARRLYRGDLLEEDRYAEWTFAERERLAERYLTLLTELAEAYAQQGRYRRAISLYHRILERDPYREAVFVRLMLAYYYAGERVQALRAFERCRRVLTEDLDVAPLPATEALAEQIRTGTLWAAEAFPRYPPPAYQGRLFEIPYSLGHTPFVGREREYAWLVARWQEARPGLVLVEGEAGVGKTRLVEEALGFAVSEGARPLRARPLREGTEAPYAPLIEALRPLWRGGWAAELPPAQREVLEVLFAPSRRSPARPLSSGEGRSPHRVEDALVRWLEVELPPEGLLFVDDAPRLDSASLALIPRLARSVTVVATARTEELLPDHPLRRVFHGLAREGYADSLGLGRLPDTVVAALIRRLAQEELPLLAQALMQRTGGNPLFLVAALQALFEEGVLHVGADGHWSSTALEVAVPSSVRAMVEERLQRLDREQRHVFDAVAVIGQDFDFALLQEVVGLEEAPLFNTLDALLGLGLVVEPRARTRGEFAPSHDVYVEVAQETLPRVRWRRLHGRVGDALQALHADDPACSARLAFHYRQAERIADAVPYALLAGELALERYALQQAATHFEQAAQWCETAGWAPEPLLQARLHAGWAEALRRCGQPASAFAHYARALPHAEGPSKLHLIYQMAALQATRGEGPETFARPAEALEAELSEPWMLGMLRCSQGFWSALRGEPARARRCAAEGWWLLHGVTQEEGVPPWLIDRATIILARTHALWGEWRHTRRYAMQALAGNVEREDAYGIADAHVSLAQASYGLGDRSTACDHAEKALAQSKEAGDLRLEGKALYPLGLVLLDGDRPEEFAAVVRRLHAIAHQTDDLEAYARGQLLQAQHLLEAGALPAAQALLEPLAVRARAAAVPSYVVLTLRLLGEVQLALGAREEARASLAEALPLAQACRLGDELPRLRSLATRIESASGK